MKRTYKKLEEFKDFPNGLRSYAINFSSYLKDHAKEYFNDPDYKASDMRDFETFHDFPVNRDHLVYYGELLLVDLEWPGCDRGNYVICQVTRGKHKLCTGRIVHLKPLEPVMPIANLKYGDWRNGYFLLPVIK